MIHPKEKKLNKHILVMVGKKMYNGVRWIW